jgi:predicted permease
MRRVRGWLLRFVSLFNKRRNDKELEDEIESHLEMNIEENLRLGMAHEEARRRAIIKLGGIESTKEAHRDQRGLPFLETLLQNLRFAFRQLLKNPGFTSGAVLTLAICIGVNLAIFAVVDAIVVRSLPLPQASRLVVIHNAHPASGVERGEATITDYFERRGRVEALESLSMYREETSVVGEAEAARQMRTAEITPEFFQTLGISLAKGATFTDAELNYGRDEVAIITDQFWRDSFGSDPNVVGRKFMMDSRVCRVIGVLPAGFRYLSSKAQIYRPLSHFPETRDLVSRYSPGSHTRDGRTPVTRYTARARMHDGQMVARLRAGRSMAEAQTQLCIVNDRRLALDPLSETLKTAAYQPRVESLRTAHVASVKPIVLMVQVGALFLLSLGGINLAGLLLIRASSRAKEIAVRQALGARHARLAGEILTETTMLSFVGGVGGVLLAVVGLRLAVSLGIEALPLGADITFDSRTGLMAVIASVTVGIGIGLPIVWLHLRDATNLSLRIETRGATTSHSVQRLRHCLIATEIAAACVLLYGAGLLGISLKRTLDKSPGFKPDRVMTGGLILPWQHYPIDGARVAFVLRLLDQLRAVPGISHAAVSSALPFTKGDSAPRGILPEGFVPAPGGLRVHYVSEVTRDYARAMGIPLLKGRFIDDADCRNDATKVAVIDEALARIYWPNADVIGQRFCTDPSVFKPELAYTVIGIVGSVKQRELAETAKLGAVYLPYTDFSNFQIIAHMSASVVGMESTLQKIVHQLDPRLPMADFQPMQTHIDESLITRRSPAILAAVFAGVALLLAGIGVYGVLAYAVSQRRREVAVRMACGATPKLIGRQFLTLGAKLVVLGVAVGTFGAWTAGRAMQSLLVEVPPFHVFTSVATVFAMSLVTLLAALLPAWRAARIHPMEALRCE